MSRRRTAPHLRLDENGTVSSDVSAGCGSARASASRVAFSIGEEAA